MLSSICENVKIGKSIFKLYKKSKIKSNKLIKIKLKRKKN